MSKFDSAPTLLVVLTDDDDPNRVTVDLRSFLRFSDKITIGLEDLVERWEHFASPMASIAALRRVALPTTQAMEEIEGESQP